LDKPLTTTAASGRSHYAALDGLRGIAILLVVFYHNFGFINYFFFGWLGVDLFFVLSGFLITGILLKTREQKNFLRNFYMRRLLRIAPLYYFSLVLFLFIVPAITNKVDFSYYISHQWWFWTYLQNWLLIAPHSSDKTTALHHFWSLAVEEQFYLIWPWIILLFRRSRQLITAIFLLLLLVIAIRTYVWFNQVEGFNYFGFYTFTRVDGLCIGSLLAVLQFKNSKFLNRYSAIIIYSLAALNFLFYFINRNNNFPYLAMIGYTTMAVLFAFLVHEAIGGNNKILNFILQLRLLTFLGKVSYGFYIFHWPLYLLFHRFFNAKVTQAFSFSAHNSAIVTSILLTAFAFVVSVLSFYFFEKHFLNLKKAFA
jgi:peptidoglycan/LPS O-acetylase OafA/YrhL